MVNIKPKWHLKTHLIAFLNRLRRSSKRHFEADLVPASEVIAEITGK